MARQTMEAWIPEEYGSDVITRIQQTSAVELFARREPMKTDTKHVPRMDSVDVAVVAKGDAYTEDSDVMDDVLLTAKKFGKVVRIAEEDLDDVPENVIGQKQTAWSTGYAKALDNASLAVTASATSATVPFLSVYAQVRAAGPNDDIDYQADDNYMTLSNAAIAGSASGSKALPYTAFSDLLGLVETGDFYDEGQEAIFAHPAFKKIWRNTMTDQGQPLLVPNGLTIANQGVSVQVDTLFGVPVKWTLGARTSAAMTKAPTGNPLAIIGPRNMLILGVRSGPESVVIDGRDGASALTDETLLKMRSRRGFNIGHPAAFGVLELVA